MSMAPWRQRFLASRVSVPSWARDEPDHLLYASNAGGTWELYGWDRRTGAHRQITDRPDGTRNGVLDPTGTMVWWFDDDKGNEFGRWVTEPFAGGATTLAASDVPAAYSAGLSIGRSFAVIGSSREDGSSIHLVRPGEPPALLYHHREHAEVAGLSRDETLLCISHSEHGDSRHPALRVVDLAGNTVVDLWDGPERGLWASGWSRVPGDQRLLVSHERNDMQRPLVWTPLTGEAVELDLDLPGEVDASWYPDAGSLLITHEYRGRSELYRFDLERSQLERIEAEPGTISGARVRPDGEVWYSWTSSASPPEVRSGSSVLLRAPGDIAPPGVTYSAHDIDGIRCFVAEPEGSRPHPTVFNIHGGPSAADWDGFMPPVQAWVDHGLAVVLVNYRGSGGYGRAWRDALQGNPGLTELEDIAKVHDWVIASAIADPERIVLAGASWGGYLTLLGLGTQPERWALGIADVPVADYIAAFEDEMEPLKAFDRALFGGSPEEIPDVYRKRSPITYIENVRVPMLVLAGESDPRCPIRQIENYLARLRELDKPHEVYRYHAGHGSLVTEERLRQMELQLDFAARQLGTEPPK